MEIVWQTPASPPDAKDYIFRNGRRYVRPYYFEFISHVKNRWAGKTIVDVFADEFKGRPREYFVGAVKCGRIQVDEQIVPVTYVVRSSQKVSHFLHRHEPPVLAFDIPVLYEGSDILTVCKPSSVPVHPCGQYRKNTVIGILVAENGINPLFPVHRLDRLVSGLLIFARTANKADQLRQQIQAGLLHKEYVARVDGVFPDGELVIDANVYYNAREGVSTIESKGKTAITKFTRISTNGLHSIVLCKPISGRTHQIRVHLQYTGHPIANDMLYLSSCPINRSTQGMGADRAATSALSQSNMSSQITGRDSTSTEDFLIDPKCTHCPNLGPTGYDVLEEGLWLHCLRYSGPDWSYEAPYPDWATLN
ncbi:pseudouridine synthase family protein isoform X2 [Wolffia australiana]